VDSVGATAKMTAAARARESRRTDRLFEDPWAEALAGAEGFAFLEQDESLRPPAPAYVVRHRFFDEFLLALAAEGVRQVVLLAAGLDTRAFRLPWPAAVRLFELDQASVLSYKETILQDAGASPNCERRTVPIDLRDDWASRLLELGYDPAAPAVWIAEGLLFYLSDAAVAQLLGTAAGLASPGSALGAETMSAAMLSNELLGAWVQSYTDAGAPFLFSTDRPAELFAQHGWEPTLLTYPELSARFGRPWPFPVLAGAQSYIVTATLAT
jgi:methyltransferase (TIGR00027 family)